MTAQLRDHLIHLRQDREGPRGHMSCIWKDEQIFSGGGGRREGDLLQQVEQVYRMEADGGSLPGL